MFNDQLSRSPIAPLWIWLKPRGLDRLLDMVSPKGIKKWWSWMENVLAERAKREEESQFDETNIRRDFFHYLYNGGDPENGGAGFSTAELWEEMQLLIIAGSDTGSIVLAGIFFYLTRHPDALARLAEEVTTTFGSVSEIASGTKLNSCKYLKAVIQEGLRMTPPAPGEVGRQVQAGGVVVDGEFFPEGTHVTTCIWALSYNEDVFPEPLKFRPERWIVGEKGVTPESVALNERALGAFSAGARGCIGKNLAWMEMSLLVAKFVYLFEIRRDPVNNLGGGDPSAKGFAGRRNPNQYQLFDTFVCQRNGPLVQLKRRAHH